MSLTRELTESMLVCQPPRASVSSARWLVLPSLPTEVLSRLSSFISLWFSSTTSLKVSAISPSMPS